MSTTRRARLVQRGAELGWAAPLVIGHRLARIAAAGPQPSARDRAEMLRMGTEKITAFQQSWWAMGWTMWRMQQQFALSLMRSMVWPWPAVRPPQAHAVATRLLASGLAPVHRRAVANAKRLGRTRR